MRRDERVVRAALGDAMSLNLLMKVLGKSLYHASLINHVPVDPRRQLAGDMATCDFNSGSPRVLPDTYLEHRGANLK